MSKHKLTASIIIVSETSHQQPETDSTWSSLKDVFDQDGGDQWDVKERIIVPDKIEHIQNALKSCTDIDQSLNLVVTAGGTGFAIKDNTPEAVSPLLEKDASGLVHAMLAASLNVTPFAMMSRPVAGVRKQTVVITVPGSPKGAKENLQAILKLLPHACIQAAGANSRVLHAGGVSKLEREAGVSSEGRPSHEKQTPSNGIQPESSHKHHHHYHHNHGGPGHKHGHSIPIPHTDPESHPRSNDPKEGPSRRNRQSPYPMLSVEEALSLIAAKTPSPRAVSTPVTIDLVGNVLAEDVIAEESVPAFRASIVDGYAIAAPEKGPSPKGVFRVSSISHATAGATRQLKPSEVARITTGAALPNGASAVVMVEDTVVHSLSEDGREEKEIEILTDRIKYGENVREIGSDIKSGDMILKKGDEISAVGGELGLLASVGKANVSVYKKPCIGVLSTGDEIVQHDRSGELQLGEVRDCNRPTLLSAVRGLGFEAVDLGIAGDRSGTLEQSLRDAMRRVDVIVTSGGVSMGELDLLKPTIERSLGGTIHFGRVSMKPGKPTTFATVPFKNNQGERETRVIFSLPGNPASAVVTFHLFVLPLLNQTAGISPRSLPCMLVTLDTDVKPDAVRPEYHRVLVTMGRDGLLHASSTGGQRSSRIGSLKSANALLCLSPGKDVIKRGEKADALIMSKIS